MFSVMWIDDKGPYRVLGFGGDEMIKLLRYKKLVLHIDATFRGASALSGFYHVDFFH